MKMAPAFVTSTIKAFKSVSDRISNKLSKEELQNQQKLDDVEKAESAVGGRIRERPLPAEACIPAGAYYVGTTALTINDIRDFNAVQNQKYMLNQNDCRHYVNKLCEYATGKQKVTCELLRFRRELHGREMHPLAYPVRAVTDVNNSSKCVKVQEALEAASLAAVGGAALRVVRVPLLLAAPKRNAAVAAAAALTVENPFWGAVGEGLGGALVKVQKAGDYLGLGSIPMLAGGAVASQIKPATERNVIGGAFRGLGGLAAQGWRATCNAARVPVRAVSSGVTSLASGTTRVAGTIFSRRYRQQVGSAAIGSIRLGAQLKRSNSARFLVGGVNSYIKGSIVAVNAPSTRSLRLVTAGRS